MRLRSLITCVLLCAVVFAPVVPAQEEDAAVAESGEAGEFRLSPEEEREARELVENFYRRFKETHDIAPEISDHFVPDFAARLRPNASTWPFAFIGWKDERGQAGPDELQRFYVATTNFLSLLFRYFDAARQKRVAEDVHEDPPLKEVLPPAAIELLKTDPVMRKMWLDDEEEGSREDAAEDVSVDAEEKDVPVDAEEKAAAEKPHEEEQLIADAAQLRSFTLLNEELSKLLREHLASHPPDRTSAAEARAGGDEDEDDDDDDDVDLDKVEIAAYARIVSEEFYGYPPGTRLVCAQAGFFHVEMVPVGGRLRILSVYFLLED
jgi:hypothetical protein